MNEVKVWEEKVLIPTYGVGEAEKNPVFLENRVYQGSSGKVYPYPVIEKICDTKEEREYRALFLENQYLQIMILPELGGRVQRAYDKTNQYDFVYYNHVIKPALVGLLGPWISGGIEFNWPQHHRPTTFMPVDYTMMENDDGSKSVLIHDVDQMYGTKEITKFTLYPDKAYLEITGQLYNRTAFPQTFLWWANPAVPANEHTQSIFPPDVCAVMDHGKRDVSRFPIATGVYYKHDYSEGVDISKYKNIPVPTSFMAAKSEYDFMGGYDYEKEAGILHIADHHISPGKKQWTWGCGDFGKFWDQNLTDEDGPYVELMTGIYTDNQPDFTWLKPFEEKTFKQYFMPYKKVGAVKNATVHAALNVECENDKVNIIVYTTEEYENVTISVWNKENLVFEDTVDVSPVCVFTKELSISNVSKNDLLVRVRHDKAILVEYQPKKTEYDFPEAAEPAGKPNEIMTNEELYLTGLHIEQYRHATYLPDPYYIEGLKRDPEDIRINNAYGSLLMRRGNFKQAEGYFRTAWKRSQWKNPNPYSSEALYNLALDLVYQQREAEAFDLFYKASWSGEQQEKSFYFLAALSARKQKYTQAMEFVDKSLVKNAHNIKARGLKAILLRKMDYKEEAQRWIDENIRLDPFDYVSRMEEVRLSVNHPDKQRVLENMVQNPYESCLQCARDYAEAGFYEEAIQSIRQCGEERPMLKYYEAYYWGQLKNEQRSLECIREAEKRDPTYTFPNKPEDIIVLKYAIKKNPAGAKAYYYLGNLYYDKLQYQWATELWEKAIQYDQTYPTAYRNLALAYYNKWNNPDKAQEYMEKAFSLDTGDARVFMELDQLWKKLGKQHEERLLNYETYNDLYEKRDDLYIEYVTLQNLIGEHNRAYELIMRHHFHPWEGGEGKVSGQYVTALVQLARMELKDKRWKEARWFLEEALKYPENLGEGKLEGTKDNQIYYYLGCAWEGLGQTELAKSCYRKGTIGDQDPVGMMYYNDQPADTILYQGLSFLKLGEKASANARFYKLINYGEQHMKDHVKIEYFAVSLPEFQIFNEDLDRKNKAHCHYLIGLGNLGLGNEKDAVKEFQNTLAYDKNHLNCTLLLKDCNMFI